MKNKILAMLLSFTLIFTTTGLSFADDEAAPVPGPEKKSEQVVDKKVEPVVEKKEINVEKVAAKEEASKVEAATAKEAVEQEESEEFESVEEVKEVANSPPAEAKKTKVNDNKLEQKKELKEKEADKGHKDETLKFESKYGVAPDDYTLHKGGSVAVSSLVPTNLPEDKEFTGWQENHGEFYAVGDSITYGNSHGNNAPRTRHFYAEFKDVTPEPVVKDVTVTFVGNHEKFVYDGKSHRVTGYEFKFSDPEYTEEDFRYTAFVDKVDRADVGTTEVVPQDLENINPNYNVTFVIEQPLAVTITPAIYHLVIHDKTKVYGEKDPKFTFDWDGPFKIDPMLYRDEGEDVGDYAIRSELKNQIVDKPVKIDAEKKLTTETEEKISDKDIEVEKPNYYIHVTNGNLRITSREITIAAVYKFKMLKDITDEEDFDVTISGLLEQDEEWFDENVWWDVYCDYDIAVGDYPIIIEVEPWSDDDWFVIDWEEMGTAAAKSADSDVVHIGNYDIKTVDNVFQIRDTEDPDDSDTLVVNPDNNGGNNGDVAGKTDKNTKQGVVRDKAVKTGDNAFLMMNALLLMAALATTLILILTRRRRKDEE